MTAVVPAEDAELLDRAQQGDEAAFTELYERHCQSLLALCRRRLFDADEAADAVQDTFLRAWRARDTFGGERLVGPWLRTIAGNVCTDVLRRRGRTGAAVPLDGEILVSPDAEPDEPILRASDAAMATAALDRVSERHREVLHLREYEEWSYERIAAHNELDLNATKSLVWRARQALRREFLVLAAHTNSLAPGLVGVLLAARRRMQGIRGGAVQLVESGAQFGVTTVAAAAVSVAASVAAAPLPPGPPAPAVAVERPAPAADPVDRAAADRGWASVLAAARAAEGPVLAPTPTTAPVPPDDSLED
jgi:RNA polymerase sigma-70 factor (ECF subfamily)